MAAPKNDSPRVSRAPKSFRGKEAQVGNKRAQKYSNGQILECFRIRDAEGIGYDKLATRLGVPKQTIARWCQQQERLEAECLKALAVEA